MAALSYGPQNSPLFNAAPSATSPLGTTTGSTVLSFGGINLGNQSVPTSALGGSTNQAPAVGNPVLPGSSTSSYLPLLLVAAAALALWYYAK